MRSFCVVIIRGTIVMLRIALVVALLVAPSARGATSILAIGDFGVGGTARARGRRGRSSVRERNPSQLLVTLGDNDYTRGRSFASSWNASFGWLAAAEVGVAGTLGNHDVQVRRGRYEFGLLRMPGPYYVRRVGEVELIVLDSTAISAAQTAWLRRTLAARHRLHADRRAPPSAVYLRRPSRQRRRPPFVGAALRAGRRSASF
jgi:hypothetical protein